MDSPDMAAFLFLLLVETISNETKHWRIPRAGEPARSRLLTYREQFPVGLC
jgi:hypothetical protein